MLDKNKKIPLVNVEQFYISRADISKNALKVLSHLIEAGFCAYLVGGCVRDLLIGEKPKDFDVVTNSSPEEIKRVFSNSRIIGKRFRLVHVYFGREIIEVATFRGNDTGYDKFKCSANGMIIRDNIYVSIDEDALRRDFTINAIYYEVNSNSFLDYSGGLQDLNARVLRVIGDPMLRYREDPVRMFRAIRLAAKLNFTLEEKAAKAIFSLSNLLADVSHARLLEEVNKWFRSGKSLAVFELLRIYGIFALLFPKTEYILINSKHANVFSVMICEGFGNTDRRLADNKTLNPAFMFAVLLWCQLQEKLLESKKNSLSTHNTKLTVIAIKKILNEQSKIVLLPKKFFSMIEEIWMLQQLLENRRKRSIYNIFHHPKFRAAYDFLLLRVESGELATSDAADWWKKFQEISEDKRREMIKDLDILKDKEVLI